MMMRERKRERERERERERDDAPGSLFGDWRPPPGRLRMGPGRLRGFSGQGQLLATSAYLPSRAPVSRQPGLTVAGGPTDPLGGPSKGAWGQGQGPTWRVLWRMRELLVRETLWHGLCAIKTALFAVCGSRLVPRPACGSFPSVLSQSTGRLVRTASFCRQERDYTASCSCPGHP